MKILATDAGFGYTKATDGRQHQLFKSILGEANTAQFGDALVSARSDAPRHFQLGDEAFFVGDWAETQSRGRRFTLDPAQFLAKHAKHLILAAIAPYAPDGEPIRLVTGLPISFFRRYRDALTALLKGRHALTVFDAQGARVSQQVYIEQVRVIPQPFGSLFGLMLNDLGRPSVQRFVTEKIGIIDIGFRTADFTISDKTRYSERGSLSTDSGISAAYAQVAAHLQEHSGVNVELFRLHEAFARGSLKIKGQTYDLKPVIAKAFDQLGERVATEVNRLWSDDWDLEAIVITGGGGQALHGRLKALIDGDVLDMNEQGDPRLANVNGYYKYGLNLWGATPAAAPKPAV
jgi:plasmid segregation protein ParM